MKIVVAAFVLLDVVLLVYSTDNLTSAEEYPTLSIAIWVNATSEFSDDVIETEGPYSNCTAKQEWETKKPCYRPFVHGMEKKKACAPLVQEMMKCWVSQNKKSQCYKSFRISEEVRNITEEDFCKKAGLHGRPFYQEEKVKGGWRFFYPCSISAVKFYEEYGNCSSKMIGMWRKDTADPKICSEYSITKQCIKKLFDTKCNYTGKTKTLLDLEYGGNFNPFCPGGVDATSGTAFCAPFGIALAAMLLLAILMSQPH